MTMCAQIIENQLDLDGFLLLAADAQLQAHGQRVHQVALEGAPQEFRCVACDRLTTRSYVYAILILYYSYVLA